MHAFGRISALPPERGRPRPQQAPSSKRGLEISTSWTLPHCSARDGRAPKRQPSSPDSGGSVKMRPNLFTKSPTLRSELLRSLGAHGQKSLHHFFHGLDCRREQPAAPKNFARLQ
jgi:hypothetical protein